MKIIDALPKIFEKTYLTLDWNACMREALALLSFHELDALPVEISRRKIRGKLVVAGFSCLAVLVQTDPRDYGAFLDQPWQDVSVELARISASNSLGALLRIFNNSHFGPQNVKFGYSWIKGANPSVEGFVSLKDLLPLYRNSIFQTDLTVADVASFPILSLSQGTRLKRALDEMFRYRVRRILVSDTQGVISDREIIGHLFAASKFESLIENPSALLDGRLGDIKSLKVEEVSSDEVICEASKRLLQSESGCLLCDRGVITPWDLVMKPWIRDRLLISKTT